MPCRAFLLLVLLTCGFLFACASGGKPQISPSLRNETEALSGNGANLASRNATGAAPRTLRVVAAGDVLIHAPVRDAAALPDGGYDFSPFFEHLTPLFKGAHLVCANLETPLAGAKSGYSGYPGFNAPSELAAGLKMAGFTAVTLANNHALDRNWAGLLRTIATVDAAGLIYMGAYTSEEDKKSRLLRKINGVKVGLLAYTYGVNGTAKAPAGEEWRLSIIDSARIKADLADVRKRGAELVVVNLHFGNEYHRKPWPVHQALVQELFDGGADLILGHHPHVVQPFVRGTGANADKAVIYSLGNLLSNQNSAYTDIGLLLDATLTVNAQGRPVLGEVKLIPVWCHKRRDAKGRLTYRVLPMADAVKNPAAYGLTTADAAVLAKSLDEITRHLASMDAQSPKAVPVAPAAPEKSSPKAGPKKGKPRVAPAAPAAKKKIKTAAPVAPVAPVAPAAPATL